MNAKLKATLTTLWNEPRAFFSVLIVCCALLFGAAALLATAGDHPHPNVQLTALFALLGLGVSFLGFGFAWIPPVRRMFVWLLRRRFLVLATIATLIALAYAVENWRGRRAWADFQREWEAKGERFNPADIAPQPVPDDENFFMTKPWEAMRNDRPNAKELEAMESKSASVLDLYGPRSSDAPGIGDLSKGTRTDLRAWQQFYRGTNNFFAGADGRVTNYFPVALSPQTPAQDVLLALSRYDETLRELHAAARRPHARWPDPYEDGLHWMPHLAKLKGCVQFLTLHALAALADGDSATALQDTQLSFRLGETLNSEPVLISYLVELAMSQIRLVVIWEGLTDHRWTDAQLAALDDALAQEDHLKNYLTGMRGERMFGLHSIEQLRRTRDLIGLNGPLETADATSFWQDTLGNSPFRLWPDGWFAQNKLAIARMHMEFTLPAVDAERHLATPQATQRMAAAVNQPPRFLSPYNAFSAMLLPALHRSAEKAARAQAYSDLARVAVALERHHLAHSEYPTSLAPLEPQFITKLPHDVINGQPLKYRRTDDGSFILYSVGWNETDDGGTVALTKGGGVDPKKGDWVWRYPQP